MLDIDKGISLKVHCPPKKQTEIIETNQKIRFEFAANFLETNKKNAGQFKTYSIYWFSIIPGWFIFRGTRDLQ